MRSHRVRFVPQLLLACEYAELWQQAAGCRVQLHPARLEKVLQLRSFCPRHLPLSNHFMPHTSIYLSIYLSFFLSFYLSIYLSFFLSIHPCIYLHMTYLPIYLSIRPSTHPSSLPSIYLSIYLPICPSIHLVIYLYPEQAWNLLVTKERYSLLATLLHATV
jgi:hypothetical protein